MAILSLFFASITVYFINELENELKIEQEKYLKLNKIKTD